MITTPVLVMLMLPVSIYLLVKNPFNGASVVAVLSWLFGVLPGLFYVETGIIPSYSWRNMTYVGGPLLNGIGIETALNDLAIITAAFTVGCLFAEMTRRVELPSTLTPRPSNQLITAVLVGVWLISVVYFLALSNWRIDLLLLPVREDVDESGYMKTIFMMTPLILFIQAYWSTGKLNRAALFWMVLTLYVAFSRPQRRDLVTVVMFFIAFFPLMRIPIESRFRDFAAVTADRIRNRAIAIAAMISALALVPILWYSRVYFSASADGRQIDPTQIRGFSEILLGSPATGYPTFLLVERHVASVGFDPLYTITYLSTIFIPRSMWSGKLTDIDNFLERTYQLTENPSIFWFGELYYGFGVFSFAIATLLGYIYYVISSVSASSSSIFLRTLAAVMFMHSITLFKNGISHFVINAGVILVLLTLVWVTTGRPGNHDLPRAQDW